MSTAWNSLPLISYEKLDAIGLGKIDSVLPSIATLVFSGWLGIGSSTDFVDWVSENLRITEKVFLSFNIIKIILILVGVG